MANSYAVQPLFPSNSDPTVYAINFDPSQASLLRFRPLQRVPKGSILLQYESLNPATCVTTDACSMWQKCSDTACGTDVVVVDVGAGGGGGDPLATADQTLTGVRAITTSAVNTLALEGLIADSDSGHLVGLDDSSILRVHRKESTRTLIKNGAPVDGTDTAWYEGQLLLDTTNGSVFRAVSKSTDPDTAATGSAWVTAISASANLAVADQLLTANRTITTGANDLNITGLSADSDTTFPSLTIDSTTGKLWYANIDASRTLQKNGAPVDGTDVAWYDGQLLVNTVNGDIYQATSPSTNPDSAATGSVWALRSPAPLALSNQPLTAARIITTDATKTLSIAGLVHNSDSQHRLVTASTIGRLQTISDDVYRVLFGVSSPSDGIVKAWYEGQLFIDTSTNFIYRASSKSTDPDTSSAGSVWVLVSGTAVPFEQTFVVADWSAPSGGFRTLSITQATHGQLATNPIHVITQEDDGTSWIEVDPNQVTINKTTGDVVIHIVDGTEFDGRAIVSAV